MYDTLSILPEVTRRATLAGAVGRRFAGRPTLYGTAARLLQAELDADYPEHTLSVAGLSLAIPQYRDNDPAQFEGYACSGLPWVLIDRYIQAMTFNLVEGFHFVTDQAGAETPRQLALHMVDLERWLDAWGDRLMGEFAQELLAFWNRHDSQGVSQWAWLAEHLREEARAAVAVAERAGQVQADKAQAFIALAQRDQALPAGAGFLEVATASILPGLPPELNPCLALALHGEAGPWLSWSPVAGFARHPSSEALCLYLAGYLGEAVFAAQPQLSLQAPLGDTFEAMARRLLEQQISQLPLLREALLHSSAGGPDLATGCELLTSLADLDSQQASTAGQLINAQLPGWLQGASLHDKRHFAAGLGQLALGQAAGTVQGMLAGLQPIEAFAAERLAQQMRHDHPLGPWPALEDVDIQLLTVPNALLNIVNAGDSDLQVRHFGWVELALTNLASRPGGNLAVSPAAGAELPAWCDADEVQRLVQAVDAGSTYLAYLREHLLASTEEGAGRRSAFASQVQVQLPHAALRLKLQQEAGFTEAGVQRLRHASLPWPDSAAGAVLCRVALQAQPGAALDVVRGVYLFAPLDGSDGPRVLYTPLARQVLREFPDLHALDTAVRQEPALREQVLAWLADDVRARYTAGGLDEPHIVRFGQGSEFAPLPVPGPAALREQRIDGDWPGVVYDECVQALLSVADRQSVSNEENRWLSYSQLGWVLFNSLLPVLSGPIATAGWMLQAFEVLGEALRAEADPQPASREAAFTDLLFNLAFFVFAEALHVPGKWGRPPEASAAPAGTLPAPRWAAASLFAQQPNSPLVLGWSEALGQLPAERRNALLAMQVPAPAAEPAPSGPAQGLVLDGNRLLAPLAEGWFEVALGERPGQGQIVDPAQPDGPGPAVSRDEAGRWRLDLGLRLRGGQVRAGGEGRARVARFQAELTAWIDRAKQQTQQMIFTYELINRTLAGTHPDRLEQANRLRENYHGRAQQAIAGTDAIEQQLLSVNREVVVPRYVERLASIKQARIALLLDIARNRQLQVVEHTLLRREAHPADYTETLDDASYLEYLRSTAQWLDELIQVNDRLDAESEALGQLPGDGPKHRDALLDDIASLPNTLDWRWSRLQIWGNLGLKEVIDAGAAAGPVRNYLIQARETVHRFNELLDELSGRNAPGSAPPGWAEAAARLETLAGELAGAEDGLAFTREGEASLAEAPWLGKLITELAALRGEVEAQLASVLDSDLRARRLQRKQQRKSSRRAHKVASQPGRRPGQSSGARPGTSGEAPAPEVSREPVEAAEALARLQLAPRTHELAAMVRDAERQLAAAPGLISRAQRWLSAERIAVEMEELLTGPAQSLEALAERIDQAVGRSNETDVATEAGSAERLALAMNNQAAQLREEGKRLRVATYLMGKPTAAALQYLSALGEARLGAAGPARPLGRKSEGEQLREAVISDAQGQPLWYAHFHYDNSGRLLAAHLKTEAQRFDGLNLQRQQASAGQQVTAIYRGRLPEAVVRELFPGALTAQ
ncbi:hypothetical protein [Pseudomonas sp. NPDC007930]|uniref:hypothetical protein n=1 Tax=Pseudomonas sp. NPDC007930 TaxID=3364417 RepID=UPI0036EEDBC1